MVVVYVASAFPNYSLIRSLVLQLDNSNGFKCHTSTLNMDQPPRICNSCETGTHYLIMLKLEFDALTEQHGGSLLLFSIFPYSYDNDAIMTLDFTKTVSNLVFCETLYAI